MSIKPLGWSTLVFAAAALALGAPGSAGAQAPLGRDAGAKAVEAEGYDFATLSAGLQGMSGLFTGGNGRPVAFDQEAAAASGFDPQGVRLAAELAAFTNDLMAGPLAAPGRNTVDVSRTELNPQRYPLLAHYFEVAGHQSRQQAGDGEAAGEEPDAAVDPNSWLSEYKCGAIWRPRPSSAAPRRTWYVGNASATLWGWGYHPTPNLGFGGGWTRPRSYSWALCGFNTYRDHATILNATTITEQLYVNYTPPGEPNPEVHFSGPWPYATWPAYVYWWHQFGPGR